jgi:hypothetical protein
VVGRNVVEQVREGMQVQTADGMRLGKVTEVWCGSEPVSSYTACDDESCLEVQGGRLYIPCSVVADVSGKVVILGVDAATVQSKPWQWKPAWIPADMKGPSSTQLQAALRYRN